MNILYQIAIIFAICLAGEAVSAALPFSFPAAIISLVIMLVLLFTKVLKLEHIRQKSDFLLSNMAFFFIPAGISVMEHFDLIRNIWWQFAIIVVLSTVAVFAVTAGTVTLVTRLEARLRRKA